MSDRTLWMLVTVSRGWPWEQRELVENRLGLHVAWARDEGFNRFVLVHGAFGMNPGGFYLNDPPRSDSIAHSVWVKEWGFPDDPHPADFRTYGRAAGPIRNASMVHSIVKRLMAKPDDAARCEAFILADSRGASGTAELAERAGILTKRNHLGKALGPAAKPPAVQIVPGQGSVVAVKGSRRGSPARHVVPDIPGPCGRCGRVSYLRTDDVLFHGDGYCVFWDEEEKTWREGCGVYRPLKRPSAGSVGSYPPPAVQAGAGGSQLVRSRAS